MNEFTGLSLSFCVLDIVRGHVPLDQVIEIRTGCSARNEAEWLAVFACYGRTYWADDNPQCCQLIASTLLATGRLTPRSEDHQTIKYGWWIVRFERPRRLRIPT